VTDSDRTATARDLARVLLALLAIYFLFGAVFSFETLVFSLNAEWEEGEMKSQAQAFAALDGGVRLLGAGLLYFLRESISARIAPDKTLPNLESREVLSLVLAGVGAFLFVSRVPLLAPVLVNDLSFESATRVILTIVLSAGLFFGATGLARIWAEMRGVR